MKLVHCLYILSASFAALGQDTLVVFDRPGVADSPYLVPEKIYFLENGIGFSDQTVVSDLLYPSIMLRKRILKSTELRLATSTFPQSIKLMRQITDKSPILGSIGIKQRVCREKKWRPETAIILNSYYNFSLTNKPRFANFVWESQLLFQSTITDWFSINYNLGYIHFGTENQHYINQSTCFNFQLSNRTGFFVENFNYFQINSENSEICYDFGFTHLLTKNIQLDLSYIANSFNKVHYGTVLTGISFYFPKK
jgi:hypothetical protein